MMAQSEPQSEKTADLRSVHTSNLPEIFEQLGISLIVSTYQAGKAIVVRSDKPKDRKPKFETNPTDVIAQSSDKLVSDLINLKPETRHLNPAKEMQ